MTFMLSELSVPSVEYHTEPLNNENTSSHLSCFGVSDTGLLLAFVSKLLNSFCSHFLCIISFNFNGLGVNIWL